MSRPVPMVDDVPLDAVAWVSQRTRSRTASIPVAGLEGDVQQALGRGSHEVQLAGVLIGAGAGDRLADLQAKAATGGEVVFSADITTALAVEHMVIVDAEFLETAGRPGRYEYFLHLRESPPLPPPARLGGLGGFGDLGEDLGFEGLDDVFGDIADVAAAAQGALDAVNDAVRSLEALAAIGDLAVGNPLEPMQAEGEKLAGVAGVAGAVAALGELLGGT